jgi:hypothetical protein
MHVVRKNISYNKEFYIFQRRQTIKNYDESPSNGDNLLKIVSNEFPSTLRDFPFKDNWNFPVEI